jgi:hypothetical protein
MIFIGESGLHDRLEKEQDMDILDDIEEVQNLRIKTEPIEMISSTVEAIKTPSIREALINLGRAVIFRFSKKS